MENGNKLLAAGNKLLSTARLLLYFFIFGLCALSITMAFCRENAALYLALSGRYDLVNFWVGVLEFLIAIGSGAAPCYVIGMIFIGLGQICVNTAPTGKVHTNPKNPLKPATPGPVKPKTQKQAQAITLHTTKVSPMLINGLDAALKEPDLKDFVLILKTLQQHLSQENEKKIIQHILDTPTNEMRSLAQLTYDKLKDYR